MAILYLIIFFNGLALVITYKVVNPGHGGGGEEGGVGHLLPGEHLASQRVLQAACTHTHTLANS